MVARGGRPDPDCPNDVESIQYRVHVSLEEDETWEQEHEMRIQSRMDPHGAAALMGQNDPVVTTTRAADPMQLVRDQLAVLDQAVPAAAAVPAESARPAGQCGFSLFSLLVLFCHWVNIF